jgi:hypothetical protein
VYVVATPAVEPGAHESILEEAGIVNINELNSDADIVSGSADTDEIGIYVPLGLVTVILKGGLAADAETAPKLVAVPDSALTDRMRVEAVYVCFIKNLIRDDVFTSGLFTSSTVPSRFNMGLG